MKEEMSADQKIFVWLVVNAFIFSFWVCETYYRFVEWAEREDT